MIDSVSPLSPVWDIVAMAMVGGGAALAGALAGESVRRRIDRRRAARRRAVRQARRPVYRAGRSPLPTTERTLVMPSLLREADQVLTVEGAAVLRRLADADAMRDYHRISGRYRSQRPDREPPQGGRYQWGGDPR